MARDSAHNKTMEELEREISLLEQQLARAVGESEKRLLKRRIKQARYMQLMLLGKLG